jgi:hypothetical protein
VCRNTLAFSCAPAPIALGAIALNEPNGRPSDIKQGKLDRVVNLNKETTTSLGDDETLLWIMIGW